MPARVSVPKAIVCCAKVHVRQARLNCSGKEGDLHHVEVVPPPFRTSDVGAYKLGGDPRHVTAMIASVFNFLGQRFDFLSSRPLARFHARGHARDGVDIAICRKHFPRFEPNQNVSM